MYYEKNGLKMRKFVRGTMCAVKCSDGNWYRAKIVSHDSSTVIVRYLDYGNCDLISEDNIKRLEAHFQLTPVLAIKVHILSDKSQSNKEILNKLDSYTSNVPLDISIRSYYKGNWMVDLFKAGTNITEFVAGISPNQSISIADVKRELDEVDAYKCVAQEAQTQAIESESKRYGEEVSKAYISYSESPDHFFLQPVHRADALQELNDELQITCPLPQLENRSVGTQCIVQYSEDLLWYRAVIISDSNEVKYIDYGNTEVIVEKCMFKRTNEKLSQNPPFAIECAMPVQPKYNNVWPQDSCQLLEDLAGHELEYEIVAEKHGTAVVKLYQGERDIVQELARKNYAVKIEEIINADICRITHAASTYDFYVQVESDDQRLSKMAAYLQNVSNLPMLAVFCVGAICAVKNVDNGLWYRGKIKSGPINDSTEVHLIDYGNTVYANELKILPPLIANAAPLAKHCSIVQHDCSYYWWEDVDHEFKKAVQYNGKYKYEVEVVNCGSISEINLFIDGSNYMQVVLIECYMKLMTPPTQPNELYKLHRREGAAEHTQKAKLLHGTLLEFYIHLQEHATEITMLYQIMRYASLWPKMKSKLVGTCCAAFNDGRYYRAVIVGEAEKGFEVQCVDYGTKTIVADVRELPQQLKSCEALAVKCCLQSTTGTVSAGLAGRWKSMDKDKLHEIKFVSNYLLEASVVPNVEAIKVCLNDYGIES